MQTRPRPSRPRLALLVGIGVWPIITTLLYLIRPVSQGWPVLLTTLALTPAMVIIMVWGLLPAIHRYFGKFLMRG
ncbi:antibiotic biosynthesis monooxygenase (ABM) superfamily enzyme [Rhodovulum sulfidophilum]|uniref:hypothetical protein n=1 Tax=Rhodovulum sulfidophilum TaxID=35806 RepID=UPI0005AA0172|nr:hypothetical protein [Rhodovulum sulfidophilum]ANB36304.1 hypothetical protein A6W98_19275 [Rhodovulum sulfidophilum DSM 1374]ANB40106.1 hypothetical protein A6024_19035 [Rhodovulum sulfidophilum]MCW2304698.1 antibiotic biosynthesis monooxygenase (ABM) superfamily enzyme [Rhodovulum sulfidophilum]